MRLLLTCSSVVIAMTLSVESRGSEPEQVIDSLDVVAQSKRWKNQDELKTLGETILQKSREVKYRQGEISGLNRIGEWFFIEEDYVQAIEYFHEALKLEQTYSWPKGRAMIWNNLGVAHMHLSNLKLSEEYLRKSLSLRSELGDSLEWAKTLNNLGITRRHLGESEEAIAHYSRAVDIALKMGDQKVAADGYHYLGIVAARVGEFSESRAYFHLAIRSFAETGDTIKSVEVLEHLALMFWQSERLDSARHYLNQAIGLQTESGRIKNNPRVIFLAGMLDYEQNRFDSALQNYTKALAAFENLNAIDAQAEVLLYLAFLYDDKGNSTQAIEYYNRVVDMDLGVQGEPFRLDALKYLGELYEANGQTENALASFKRLGDAQEAYHKTQTDEAVRKSLLQRKAERLEHELAQAKTDARLAVQNEKVQALNLRQALLWGGLAIGIVVLIGLWYFMRQKVRLQKQVAEAAEHKARLDINNAMFDGEMAERIRVARILHDDVSGTIAASSTYFSTYKSKLEKDTEADIELVLRGQEMLRAASKQVRLIGRSMVSSVLIHHGLPSAIEELAGEIQREFEIECLADCDTGEFRWDQSIELGVYRIVEELVTNAAQHSHGTRINVLFRHDEKAIVALVEDDGVGIAPESRKDGWQIGLGLAKKRAGFLGGMLRLETNQGTKAEFVLPEPIAAS